MPAITDWDIAYSNRDHSPDWPEFVEKWTTAAPAFREKLASEGRMKADVAYGGGERNTLDLFLPEGTPKGLAIFIHGDARSILNDQVKATAVRCAEGHRL